MPVKNHVQYLLINGLKISKKEALAMIEKGDVWVNGNQIFENIFIRKTDDIRFQNQILQVAKKVITIPIYKPRGVETTLNEAIPDNLKSLLPEGEKLFPIGRLDKESEGLLILTNDGDYYHDLLKHGKFTEKEYIVSVNRPIDDDFVQKMSSGIEIRGKRTLPCQVKKIDDFTFNIILTQGLNRQIRRMCYQLDYEVTRLVRIRFGEVTLDDVK
jgi:23S rRNA pseudouridine2604 synthase